MNAQKVGQSVPLGFLLVLALAAALFAATLVDALTVQSGGGEAAIAAAYEGFFLTVGLWLALALLLLIGGLMGEMPRAAALVAIPLVPASGVAAFVALDMCSRQMPWAALFIAALAPLLAFYALWARLPRLRAAIPAKATSLAVWGAISAISAAAFAAAATW
jgi:hypothetical protein